MQNLHNSVSFDPQSIMAVSIAAFADGREVVYLNINREFLNEKGELPVDVMPDLLHPNERGYEIWGRTMQPVVSEMISSTRAPNSPP